jgi:hypothetical protein
MRFLLPYIPKEYMPPSIVMVLSVFLITVALVVSPGLAFNKVILFFGTIAGVAALSVIAVWLIGKRSTASIITKDEILLVALLTNLERGRISNVPNRYISKPLHVSQGKIIGLFDKFGS